MPVPPAGHSSSIDSASSFSSSKSSLLAPPLDEASSQSDYTDSVPLSMPHRDALAHGVAASPSHSASKATNTSTSSVSATQKFKRAFGKRRRPSQDAGTLLSSGDERYTSDSGASASSSFPSVSHPSTNRPPAAKLTMHFFGGRRPTEAPMVDPNEPPPVPPKPSGLRAPVPPALQIPTGLTSQSSTEVQGLRLRSSVMATSPSITAAIEFMREDEDRQRAAQRPREIVPHEHREAEEDKENWRKSDSTMASGHTVRPTLPSDAPGAAGKRLNALLPTPPGGGDIDLLEFTVTAPESEGPRQDSNPADAPTSKQSKRRSLSLNIHVPAGHTPSHSPSTTSLSSHTLSSYPTPLSTPDPASMHSTHSPTYSISLSPSPRPSETLTITHTPANGIIGSSSTSGSPKVNIRGRLAAWTSASGMGQRSNSPLSTAVASTSTPSLTTPSATSFHSIPHRRVPVTSDASQPSPELQAVAAVRQLQNRVRSPSGASNSNTAGIRQAATSLTNGAGAMALGLGKRAYEKVGRVWGGSQSGSGSGSDTPSTRHQGSTSTTVPQGWTQPQPPQNSYYGPSAFPPPGRRTPNAPSGTWSVSSMGGSRSSSERDRSIGGRDTPSGLPGVPVPTGLGKLIRPPRSSGGGAVFGRDLWECVKETRAALVSPGRDPLACRMVPALVYRCAQHLHRWGIEEEGLFRISGRSSHIARLRNEFDSGADYDIIECSPSELDPHAVASVFKAYLRELPEPILTRALGPLFDAAVTAENSRAAPASPNGSISKTFGAGGPGLPAGPRVIPMIRKPPSLSTFTLPNSSSLRAPSTSLIETLGDLISRLPRENRDLLQTVVGLMKATAARSKETKMPLSNLLLVFCPSLSMGPTLLRVLCDVPSVWEREPPLLDISRATIDDEEEDSDESVSESDSASEDEQLVSLPSSFKGKGKELPVGGPESVAPASETAPDIPPPQVHIDTISVPLPRPRAVRRVPVPTLFLKDHQMDGSLPFTERSFTPPLLTDALAQSGSTLSLEVPSRSLTPSSPERSEASLTSTTELDNKAVAPSPRTRQLSSPSHSSEFVSLASWGAPDRDKCLPASPRSPTQPDSELLVAQQAASVYAAQLTDEPHADKRMDETPVDSVPQLPLPKHAQPERALSLPTPMHIASRSAPSVVFPSSSSKMTPSTPVSLKKHAITLSLGRSPKLADDEDLPSPSKRLVRRPSLNMLFNMKRNGPPSPRSRTPTISSPLSSPISMAWPSPNVELSPKTVTNPFPPVLNLPLEGSMDVGWGWDDVFGGPSSEKEMSLAPPQSRPTAISQPSIPPPWSQPPSSPLRRPTTEYLASSNSSSNDSPSVFPSATAVLETADSGGVTPSSPDGLTSIALQEDISSGDDSPPVDSPTDEPYSPPPHLNFQLRRSSLDEDWASAVLFAAGGKSAEPVA